MSYIFTILLAVSSSALSMLAILLLKRVFEVSDMSSGGSTLKCWQILCMPIVRSTIFQAFKCTVL